MIAKGTNETCLESFEYEVMNVPGGGNRSSACLEAMDRDPVRQLQADHKLLRPGHLGQGETNE